jgi:hypothetical protein
MLYETLLQGKIFLCAVYFGLIAGIFLTAKKIVDGAFKKSKIAVLVTDIVFCVLCAILFLICINIFNFGEFRLFELLGYALGIALEQFSLNKIVEKIFQMLYTFFIKVASWLKKSKLFGKVLK